MPAGLSVSSLGGRPDDVDSRGEITNIGFQICHAHKELVDFIHWVKTRRERLDANFRAKTK